MRVQVANDLKAKIGINMQGLKEVYGLDIEGYAFSMQQVQNVDRMIPMHSFAACPNGVVQVVHFLRRVLMSRSLMSLCISVIKNNSLPSNEW